MPGTDRSEGPERSDGAGGSDGSESSGGVDGSEVDASRPPIARSALAAPVLDVAPSLLGALVVRDAADGRVVVRITEVEAYAGEDDPGSHAFRGRTPRTEVMFGPAGHAYVYFSYGMHWCLNVVAGPEGTAAGVLLRAGEVVAGLDVAHRRRGPGRRDAELARGPANLARALGVDAALGGADLCAPASPLRVLPARRVVQPSLLTPAASPAPSTGRRVERGPRVGVSGPGGDGAVHPWRFWLAGERSVSAYRPGVVRGARRRAEEPR